MLYLLPILLNGALIVIINLLAYVAVVEAFCIMVDDVMANEVAYDNAIVLHLLEIVS
jgi:hypothetical protein